MRGIFGFRAFQILRLILLTITLLFLTGCSPSSVPGPPMHVAIEDIPIERVEFNREWRNVRTLPGGPPVVIDVPVEPGASILRFGAFPDAASNEGLSICIQLGERMVVEKIEPPAGKWKDFRLDLKDALSAEDTFCRLTFQSDKPFYLHELKVIGKRKEGYPDIIVFLIDALRMDHVGCYGYPKPTTPFIDRFAADAIRITGLSTQSSWTRPSVCSLFSSTYPPYHGAEERFEKFSNKGPTIAAALTHAGYETACLMSNPNCLPDWNIGHEFDRFIDIDSLVPIPDQDDKNVIDAAIDLLSRFGDQPSFLYIHTMSPHWPYTPPKEYLERIRGAAHQEPLEPLALNGGFEIGTGDRAEGWHPLSVDGTPSWRRTDRKRHDGTYALMSEANLGTPGDLLHAKSEPFPVKENDVVSVSGYVSSYGEPDDCATIAVRGECGTEWSILSSRAWAMRSNAWQLVEDAVTIPAGVTRALLSVYAKTPQKKDSGWFVDGITCTVRSSDDPDAGEAAFQRDVIDCYDAEIAYVDEQFGRLIEALKERELYDDTLIVVTSDHGEEFWDHGGTEHGKTLFEEQLRVPFLIKLPGQENGGTARTFLTETIDIAPTLLDIVGIPVPVSFQGMSLLALIRQEEGTRPKEVSYAFLRMDGRNMGSAKSESHSYLVDFKKNTELLFHLPSDPRQQIPVPLESVGQDLRRRLDAILAAASAGLHVYLQFDVRTDSRVTGIIRSTERNLGAAEVSGYPVDLEPVEDGVRFTVDFKRLSEDVLSEGYVRGLPQHQGHTELVFSVLPDEQVELEIEQDGRFVPPERIFGARPDETVFSDGNQLNLRGLTSSPHGPQSRLAENKPGIYLWYVPPAAGSVDALDDDMLEALRSLGYIH